MDGWTYILSIQLSYPLGTKSIPPHPNGRQLRNHKALPHYPQEIISYQHLVGHNPKPNLFSFQHIWCPTESMRHIQQHQVSMMEIVLKHETVDHMHINIYIKASLIFLPSMRSVPGWWPDHHHQHHHLLLYSFFARLFSLSLSLVVVYHIYIHIHT